jgi:hypothetical protein
MDVCTWYDWTRFIPISVVDFGFICFGFICFGIYCMWQRHKSIKEFNKKRDEREDR